MKKIKELFENKDERQLFLTGKIFETEDFEDFKKGVAPETDTGVLRVDYLRQLGAIHRLDLPTGEVDIATKLVSSLEWLGDNGATPTDYLDTMKRYLRSMMRQNNNISYKGRYNEVDKFIGDFAIN